MRRKFSIDYDSIENQLLIQSEVRNILNGHSEWKPYESRETINFRCNVCGDSKESKFKKRGYIIKTHNPWSFCCHNCQASMPALAWIKKYFPYNFTELNRLMDKNKTVTDTTTYDNIKTEKPKDENEADTIKTFKKIEKYPDVVAYCESRMIPKEIYSKWFYAEDGDYKDRLIIPFYNKKGTIYYYQGRAMHGWMIPKYKSRKGSKFISIYNYYHVDKEKPVVVVEGPIDSIFVENCVAVTGLKTSDERLDAFNQKYFLLDNDPDARKKCRKLLDKSQYVFMWNRFLENHTYLGNIKDINDFILKNTEGIKFLTWEMIAPYFTNKAFDKMHFLN